jgi:hypothetical protein
MRVVSEEANLKTRTKDVPETLCYISIHTIEEIQKEHIL